MAIAGFTINLTSRHPDDIIRSIPGDDTTMTATLYSLPPFTEYTIQLSVRNAVELEGEPAVIMGMTDSFSKTHGFITTCSITKYGSTSYTSTGMTDSFCFAVEST